jgi:tripartite ATP-independent transporter DctM subunit
MSPPAESALTPDVNAVPAARVGADGGVLIVALALATLLPLAEAAGRPLGFHVSGAAAYLQQVTLWLTFVGGLVATRHRTHLTLSTAELLTSQRARQVAGLLAACVAAAVLAVLAYSGVELVRANREQGKLLGLGIPEWASECVIPAALALMAVRFAWTAPFGWWGRALALFAIAVAFGLGLIPSPEDPAQWAITRASLVWPGVALILAGALLGAPVFVAMGGLALLFFFKDGTPVGAVSAEVYRLIASPTIPAIPLLTTAGFVLAAGESSARLVRCFEALFGWMPGGIAVVVVVACAAFTTGTGGSGLTIMALGGLVLPMLARAGYPEGFSLGLVTASGSLGLLFPPSLPVILYAVVAGVPADELYLAGFFPGLLLVVLACAYGVHMGLRTGERRRAFVPREALAGVWAAKWELSLPLLVIALFASGAVSIVEASAAACAYAVVVACFVNRDLRLRQLPAVLVEAGALVGAVLILLSVALGLTSYLVDAQLPEQFVDWVKTHIHSQLMFLLVLNIVLLVLGSVLEIYSAIIILVPLVIPMGAAFQVDPIHLGVIFLANLELGFLLPPVGLNLFLSAARFGKPLPALYRHVVPFLVILALGVLLITYVPDVSLGILKVMGKR